MQAVARYLDQRTGRSRALCCFGHQKRSEQAHLAVEQFERACRAGDGELRLVASAEVRERDGGDGCALRMLLLARNDPT